MSEQESDYDAYCDSQCSFTPAPARPGSRDYDLKDSGTRREFDTGAKRDAATGKGRYDLISPLATRRKAILLEKGAIKYDARNWEKGMPLSVFLDCAKRHLDKYLEGLRDEDHLAAASWNIDCMMHFEEMIARGLKPAELDDMPSYVPAPVDQIEITAPPPDDLFHVEVLVPVEGEEPQWVEQGHGRDSFPVAVGAAEHLFDTRTDHAIRVKHRGVILWTCTR
jgi:hypothetical protein